MRYCRVWVGRWGALISFGSVVRLQRFLRQPQEQDNRRSDMVSVTQPWYPTLATSLWSVSVSALRCECTELEVLGLLCVTITEYVVLVGGICFVRSWP